MALALPRLSRQVPRSIAPAPLLAANASVSRFLVEAEAFEEGDIPATWSDSLDACRQALDGWLKRQIGPLHCLNPRFALHMLSSDGDWHSHYGPYAGRPGKDREVSAVEASWCENQEQEWAVGEALTVLSRHAPDLGLVVLNVLRRQSAWVYPVFTPDIACDVTTYLYWCGEDNEEAALDMHCGEDGHEREAMREEMVSKATLEAAYPAWARSWPRGLEMTQCTRFLRRVVKRQLLPIVKAVAEDALVLSTLNIDDSFRPSAEGEFVGFGAVLSWTEGDVTTRIYDDLLNLAHQGEYCEAMGEFRVPLDDPEGFAAWQCAMANRFEAIRRIDALIYRLSATHWSRR